MQKKDEKENSSAEIPVPLFTKKTPSYWNRDSHHKPRRQTVLDGVCLVNRRLELIITGKGTGHFVYFI